MEFSEYSTAVAVKGDHTSLLSHSNATKRTTFAPGKMLLMNAVSLPWNVAAMSNPVRRIGLLLTGSIN